MIKILRWIAPLQLNVTPNTSFWEKLAASDRKREILFPSIFNKNCWKVILQFHFLNWKISIIVTVKLQ